MSPTWTLADMGPQTGKRFFITGANSGVGYWAAVELARRGAVVVLACRDEARAEAARAKLQVDAAGSGSAAQEAEIALLNLGSLQSVHDAAERESSRRLPLHGLINNAGVFATQGRQVTEDGFELQFGTNVLGHFALTCRLMPMLEMGRAAGVADAPRVVTLASVAHKRATMDFDDLQWERAYNATAAYARSKLGDLMFAFELERRLREAYLGAVSIAVHPGVAQTRLFKVGSGRGLSAIAERLIAGVVGKTLNTGREGALPTLYGATAGSARGGHYYGPQGFMELRGGDVGPAKVSKVAQDIEAQARLWGVCERLTGVAVAGPQALR